MDIVGLLKSSYSDYGTILTDSWYYIFADGLRSKIILSICIATFIIGIAYGLYYWQQWKIRVQERLKFLQQSASKSGPRFRKRDKMLFYGRRMLRKVKTLSGQAYNGQGRKRRAVMKFARKILQLKNDNTPLQYKSYEPPAEYLEETVGGKEKVPPDVLYLLQNIRVFGHFEKPVFLKLCKNTEIINLEPNEILFTIGDSDDSVFIVQSGLVNVSINNTDGSILPLKFVRPGESVTSLLSFIDVLVGTPSFYKTVTARAVDKCQVIRLPAKAFLEVFEESPDILVRVIQVIMVRLQRVTFTALRNYLGLHSELIQFVNRQKKTAPTATNMKNSPGHRRQTSQDLTHCLSMQSSSEQKPDMIADLSQPVSRRISLLNAGISGEPTDESLLKSIAVEGFLRELGLNESEETYMMLNVEVKELQPGETVIHEGDNDTVSLIYLISGSLSVYQQSCELPGVKQKEKTEIFTYSVHPGELTGGLAVLTGEASLFTLRAKHFSRVGLLRKEIVYNILRENPKMIIDLARSVLRRLSPLVRQCDFALDWIFLESGRGLYRQDEVSDSTYIVLSGRLRSVITHANGKKEIVAEFGKGDLIGICEMITETPRTTTVIAVRDSELAKLPDGLFNAIKLRYPSVVTQLISLLGHRILGSYQGNVQAGPGVDATPANNLFSTVAIVPVNEDVPLTAFTYELYHSLCAIGPTRRLTSELVRKTLGVGIMESSNEYRLTSWLAQQEDRVKIALYQCDTTLTAWTQRCMRQADVILIVGLGDNAPIVGKMEREIDRLAMRTQKELVLLHYEGMNSRPTNTVQWLNMRSWVTKHHHLQCPKRMFTRRSQYRVNELYSKVLMSEPNMHSDFSRLARWLTGNSVGLVLGGGGARGAAHVGMLKAIQEAGIPIDMVGGVSIGALMGALWCSEKNITTMTQKAREWSYKMTQWWRQLLDLTYPITSMFSGRDFNKTIHGTFGDIYIEDLWIPYFTLTTDITASCARIHTHGSLWRYVRSSMSLSGYMPPLCDPKDGHLLLDGGYVNNLPGFLWRYCRASMSIAGVFPPMCDHVDGHLLVDGCYSNNVPADVMRAQGAAHIIAIDVGSQDDKDLTDYGDDLSGWWLLYKRLNPFTSPVKVPNLPDIQSRLAYVSCVRQLEVVKTSDYCEYIRPPIDNYKTLAFGSFDEIRDVGYVHGRTYFENMAKNNRLARFNQWSSKEDPSSKACSHSLKEYTFTDLAQIVCRVPETYADKQSSSSSDDEFEGYISEPSNYMDQTRVRSHFRSGGTMSLSENEMDSDDLEMPLPLKFSTKDDNFTKKSLSAPSSSETTPKREFEK